MKVILTRDVPKLGRAGHVVDVSPGYARNFLFPRKLAQPATDRSIRAAEERSRKEASRAAEQRAKDEALARAIRDIRLTLTARSNTKGKLYGRIDKEAIRRALASSGAVVPASAAISFDKPIETVGEHTVTVALQPDLRVPLRLEVKPL